jgi:hypothetical protein
LTLCLLGPTFIAVMSSAAEPDPPSLRPSIFLSYASEDRVAASSIRDTMAAAGLEVWYDENELGGGDAWDKKIRRQIRECDYFLAIISAQTEARHEGYFRREWRLAVERALDMADDHTFLLPVVIDGTDQTTARVPERFLVVQWLKVPNGQATPGLKALCARLVSGSPVATPTPRRAARRAKADRKELVPMATPEFPTEEAGQKVKFWVHVVGWALRSAWVGLQRLPRWIRLLIYAWLFIFLLSRGCARDRSETGSVSPEAAQRLKAIAEKYQGSSKKDDIAKLGTAIAHEFSNEAGENARDSSPLLAIPFAAPPTANPEDAKLANTTFALLYGRLSISHQGQVALSAEPISTLDTSSAVDRGRKGQSSYVICGGIENRGGVAALTVDLIKVSDGSLVWSKSYPVSNADPSAIASEVEARVPSLDAN